MHVLRPLAKSRAQLATPPKLIIRGASAVNGKANGTYLLTENTEGDRPVYEHESDARFQIKRSTTSSVWMLDDAEGSPPYTISGRADAIFPADAPWQDYLARPSQMNRASFCAGRTHNIM